MVTWSSIFPGRNKRAGSAREQVIEADGVVFDVLRRRAQVDGHVVHLPATEARLLGLLMTKAGRIVGHTELLHAAFGASEPTDQDIERHLRRLRRRLTPSPLSPNRVNPAGEAGYIFQRKPT